MILTTTAEIAIKELFCDDCKLEMKATDYVLTSNPPQFPHVCPNGHKATLYKRYPMLVTRKVGEKEWKSLG
jgi:hypothetical protein